MGGMHATGHRWEVCMQQVTDERCSEGQLQITETWQSLQGMALVLGHIPKMTTPKLLS